MERSLLWILTGLAPISAYALAPVVPASVGAVALIAATVFAIRTTFEVGPLCRHGMSHYQVSLTVRVP